MRRRFTLATLTALVVLLAAAAGAPAKTIISSADVPSETTAGQAFDVQFQLEDHGGLLATVTEMTVVARPMGATDELTFAAAQDGDTWIAQVMLPEAGTWLFLVRSDELGFQQDLGSTAVAENPFAPATTGRLQTELETLRTELDKGINAAVMSETKALESEVLSLEKQVAGLLAEQDALRAELAAVQAANAEQNSGLTVSWWVAGGVAMVIAAVAAAAFVIARRGGFTLRLPARSTAH